MVYVLVFLVTTGANQLRVEAIARYSDLATCRAAAKTIVMELDNRWTDQRASCVPVK